MSDRGRELRLRDRQRAWGRDRREKGREDIGACVSSLIYAARERRDAATGGRRGDAGSDRVNLCATDRATSSFAPPHACTQWTAELWKLIGIQIQIQKHLGCTCIQIHSDTTKQHGGWSNHDTLSLPFFEEQNRAWRTCRLSDIDLFHYAEWLHSPLEGSTGWITNRSRCKLLFWKMRLIRPDTVKALGESSWYKCFRWFVNEDRGMWCELEDEVG